MVAEKDFDFKIRDELKKRSEYTILRTDLLRAGITTETGEHVTGEMIVDMVTFCSKGDLDLAILGLRESQQFVIRCLLFLRPLPYYLRVIKATKLLFEIWRAGFATTKCVLDWNSGLGDQVLSHGFLQQKVAFMHALDNEVSSLAKLHWIDHSIYQFERRSLLINEIWKKRKKIFELQKT